MISLNEDLIQNFGNVHVENIRNQIEKYVCFIHVYTTTFFFPSDKKLFDHNINFHILCGIFFNLTIAFKILLIKWVLSFFFNSTCEVNI